MASPKSFRRYKHSEEFRVLAKLMAQGRDSVEFKTSLYSAELLRKEFNSWRLALEQEAKKVPVTEADVAGMYMGVAEVSTRISPPRNQRVRKDDPEAYAQELAKPVTLTFFKIFMQERGEFGQALAGMMEEQGVCNEYREEHEGIRSLNKEFG